MGIESSYLNKVQDARGHNEAAHQKRGFFEKGIVALPLMLLISGIVLEMTIAATLIVFYLLQGSVGARNAAEALTTAQSGVNDASVRLVRNKGLSGNYTFAIDTMHQAQISVCNGTKKGVTACSIDAPCGVVNANKVEITSLGKVRGSNKCIRVIYAIDEETGEIKMESSGEITL